MLLFLLDSYSRSVFVSTPGAAAYHCQTSGTRPPSAQLLVFCCGQVSTLQAPTGPEPSADEQQQTATSSNSQAPPSSWQHQEHAIKYKHQAPGLVKSGDQHQERAGSRVATRDHLSNATTGSPVPSCCWSTLLPPLPVPPTGAHRAAVPRTRLL